MTYIVYTANGSYSVLKEEFNAKNFIGANVFDPESGEMFIVTDGTLISLSKEETVKPPAEPEVPPVIEEPEEVPEEVETPAEEETPSEEQVTE